MLVLTNLACELVEEALVRLEFLCFDIARERLDGFPKEVVHNDLAVGVFENGRQLALILGRHDDDAIDADMLGRKFAKEALQIDLWS